MSFFKPIDSINNSSPYGYQFANLEKISDEGLCQYWEEVKQQQSLPLALRTLMHNIDRAHPQALYSDRFTVLTDKLRHECRIHIPEGIYPVATAHFKSLSGQIQLKDTQLLQLWDDIELQIPADKKASFTLRDTPEQKAQKIRAWFQNPEHNELRAMIDRKALGSLQSHDSKQLLQLWDDIESQVPADKKAGFTLSDTPEQKAQKILAWLQDPQFSDVRAAVGLQNLYFPRTCPEAELLGSDDFIFVLDQNQISNEVQMNCNFPNCVIM